MYQRISDIRKYFKSALDNEEFTVDRGGLETIELIGASFIADEPAIFGTPNEKYIQAEIEWYRSESTNINTLGKIYGSTPEAWKYSANKHGEINSNYGQIVFGQKYYNQFENVIEELIFNPDTRRAQLVYNRPSIWVEFHEDGKNDFICTNAQTVYIRDGKLQMVSQMRSNDVVFGYRNDYAWAQYIMDEIVYAYNGLSDTKITKGELIWQVQNLHVYSRHFHLVQ